MNIAGLQKMTLLDFPGRVACTVFLAGCNFRCPFCHNAEICDPNAPAEMTDTGLLEFLKKRVGLLDGVAFTGGEPLMSEGLADLLMRIRGLGYQIKLDTDGAWPNRLESILKAGLVDYVAMDVKNSPARYPETCGVSYVDMDKIKKSIELIMEYGDAGAIDYEFRTTVVDELHDADSFRGIAELIAGAKAYYLQPFTDRDTVVFEGFHAPSEERLKEYAEIAKTTLKNVNIRGL